MTEHEERIRGADAQHLLNNELLKEALATIEANVVSQLSLADIAPERILKLQSILAGKRAFEKYLMQLVTTGKMASLEEERKRTFTDRLLRRA